MKINLNVRSIVIGLAVTAVILRLGSGRGFGPTEYAQLTLDGLRSGSIYALIAVGFVVVFNVTKVINFAQGAFVMLGAMITADVYSRALTGSDLLNLVIAAAVAITLTTAVGVITDIVFMRPIRKSNDLVKIIVTVGLFTALEGLALLKWGPNALRLPAFNTFLTGEPRDSVYRPFGLLVKGQSIWIWLATIVLLVALTWFFTKTMKGRAFKASASNELAANLMGINSVAMATVAFGLAAALGAVGGILVAPATAPIYDMGLRLGLKGFVSAVTGGLRSVSGAVAGGILLGVIENVAAGVTKAGLRDIWSAVILILVLLYRPEGLFAGKQETEKV